MPSRRVNVWLSPSSLMSTPSAISGKGLEFGSSLYRPDITFWSISVETESVVCAESRSLTVCSRLMATDLLLPPPPPPALPLKTPQPAVPSRVAPARPAPPSFKKSFRDIPGTRRGPFIPNSSVLMDSPFSSRRLLHGNSEHPSFSFAPLYGGLMTPNVLLSFPETLCLRSIRSFLTIVQRGGPTRVVLDLRDDPGTPRGLRLTAGAVAHVGLVGWVGGAGTTRE